MVEYQGDVKLPNHSLLSWLWEVDVVLDGTDGGSQRVTQQGVGKPCIRTVPEDFLADEAVRKEFDKLCQS